MRVLSLYIFCTLSIIVCVISTLLVLALSTAFGSHAEGTYSVEIYAVILLAVDLASFFVFRKARRSLAVQNRKRKKDGTP